MGHLLYVASFVDVRVAEFLTDNENWRWQSSSMYFEQLWDKIRRVRPYFQDRSSIFPVASAWEAVRPRGERVCWHSLLWFGGIFFVPPL